MHATKIYKMTDNYSTMASEDEIYCTICGAGFTQVRALEFHQSAHDVRFMPSELDRLAKLTKDYDNRGEINWHEGQICATRTAAIKISRAHKQASQVTAPNETLQGSPTSAATEYEYPAIMPTSRAEALTVSPTPGPFRACFFVRQRVCSKKPLPQAHDPHPGLSPDYCSTDLTLRYSP